MLEFRIGTLVVAHKDRLVWFGFEYLEHVAAKNGCTILMKTLRDELPGGAW